MKIELCYNLVSLHAAASYIWDNNPAVRKWPSAPISVHDVLYLIHTDMVRYACANANTIIKERNTKVRMPDAWLSFTGTGGYYLMFDLQSDEDSKNIMIGVDILVDPGVGSPTSHFTTEVIDMSLKNL
jgi:hypothetical protein